MAKELDPLVYDNFQRGISPSAAFGFQEMVGIDLITNLGFARVNAKLKLDSSTTITDTVNWIKKSGPITYALADNGKLYKRESGTWSEISGTTGTEGSGLAIYKGYLFNFEGITLEVYNLTTPGWVTTPFGGAVMPGGGLYGYHCVIGSDDKLYATGNELVVSFAEKDGKTFNPANDTTYDIKYTTTDPALDLPSNYQAVSLVELGNDLMVAANNSNSNNSDIFPWDKVSPSFELPIRLGLNDIHATVAYNNAVYLLAGVEGSVYRTNGVGVELLATIPNSIINRTLGYSILINPAAICVFNNKIYFANSYTSTNRTPAYIWSFNPATGALNIEHTIPNGNVGSVGNSLLIDSLAAYSDTELMVGFKDSANSTQGIAILDTTRRYTGYTAYILTNLTKAGSFYRPRTFQFCEVNLTKPLATGEGVKVQIRDSLAASWTTAKTIATCETVGQQFFEVPYAGTHRMVQLKISLTTPSNAESTPELASVILR